MSKHTPGPWVCHSGSVYRAWPVDTDGYATVRVANMDRDEPHTAPTERDANAHLIAAAPELLAAALHVVEMTTPIPDAVSVYVVSDAIKELRAVIAKAEGTQ